MAVRAVAGQMVAGSIPGLGEEERKQKSAIMSLIVSGDKLIRALFFVFLLCLRNPPISPLGQASINLSPLSTSIEDWKFMRKQN